MIHALATLAPSIRKALPINLLVSGRGTPLADGRTLDPLDFVRTVRGGTPSPCRPSMVRLSAGRRGHDRRVLQTLCFVAGANSILLRREVC